MKVSDLAKSLLSIQQANIANYEDALDNAIMYFRKVKATEKELKDISLNAYKKYKNMEITVEEANKIIESITNIKE